jgi:hypothetical protein
MKSIFSTLMHSAFNIYSPMLAICIYKNCNNKIDKEVVEISLKFSVFKEEMINYVKNKNFLTKKLWDLIGYYLAIYCFIEYKKDNSFINNLSLLNDSINDKSLEECLNIINLKSIDEVGIKAINNLDEYVKLIHSFDEEIKQDDELKK